MTNDIVNGTTEVLVRRKRRGRPAAKFPRVIILKLRASLPEADRINGAANASRLPTAAYIRKRALAEITIPLPACDIETAAQIARVSHIFEQAVRLCESGKATNWPAEELDRLRELCSDIALRLTNPGAHPRAQTGGEP
jgi:hypothetical protein